MYSRLAGIARWSAATIHPTARRRAVSSRKVIWWDALAMKGKRCEWDAMRLFDAVSDKRRAGVENPPRFKELSRFQLNLVCLSGPRIRNGSGFRHA